MMVSKVLRTLEEKKFISRQEHHTDTRAKVIKLTAEGAKVLQKALTAVENADIEFFSMPGHHLALFNESMAGLIEKNKGD
jgi:DNA-binding MarR family transcriptional regulator